MHDLTRAERAAAASQNWGLYRIFDLHRKRWSMNVLPVNFGPGITAEAALAHVVAAAQRNDPLAVKALRLMAAFNAGKTANKEKKA